MKTERELFEAWAYSKKWNIFRVRDMGIDRYVDDFVDGAWSGWQASKAQEIPEGFVLVKKEPDAALVNHGHQVFLGHFNEGGQTGGRSLYFAYKAMIEAQESDND